MHGHCPFVFFARGNFPQHAALDDADHAVEGGAVGQAHQGQGIGAAGNRVGHAGHGDHVTHAEGIAADLGHQRIGIGEHVAGLDVIHSVERPLAAGVLCVRPQTIGCYAWAGDVHPIIGNVRITPNLNGVVPRI